MGLVGVEDDVLFPAAHPLTNAAPPINTNPRDAACQKPCPVVRLFTNARGSRNRGSSTKAEVAPGTVSVKITVIWYRPAGVEEAVAMVRVLLVAE